MYAILARRGSDNIDRVAGTMRGGRYGFIDLYDPYTHGIDQGLV
jgi:hypothetical protein